MNLTWLLWMVESGCAKVPECPECEPAPACPLGMVCRPEEEGDKKSAEERFYLSDGPTEIRLGDDVVGLSFVKAGVEHLWMFKLPVDPGTGTDLDDRVFKAAPWPGHIEPFPDPSGDAGVSVVAYRFVTCDSAATPVCAPCGDASHPCPDPSTPASFYTDAWAKLRPRLGGLAPSVPPPESYHVHSGVTVAYQDFSLTTCKAGSVNELGGGHNNVVYSGGDGSGVFGLQHLGAPPAQPDRRVVRTVVNANWLGRGSVTLLSGDMVVHEPLPGQSGFLDRNAFCDAAEAWCAEAGQNRDCQLATTVFRP